jgi:hypothetical protein
MKKKKRIFQENIKIQHTAHWNWDYFTAEEIEQRLKEAGVGPYKKASAGVKNLGTRRSAYGIWIGICLLILATVLLVVILL